VLAQEPWAVLQREVLLPLSPRRRTLARRPAFAGRARQCRF
jgi:hypothetical protein